MNSSPVAGRPAMCLRGRISPVNPFVAAQVQSLIEDIRLLEVLVTAPLGLHSDLRMLRQSIPLPQAADPPRDEERQRRRGYLALTDDAPSMALSAIEHLGACMALLQSCNADGGSPLGADWMSRAERVLDRARQKMATGIRSAVVSQIQGLCVIVDPDVTGGRSTAQIAASVLRGGTKIILLRDNAKGRGDVLTVARQISALCGEHGALFIMDADPVLALSSDAHGLQLGQSDLPVPEARSILAPGQLLGLFNSSLEEVARSQAAGADYLALGPIYADPTMGTDLIARAKELASQPVVAVGGITIDNLAEVVSAGADCVCVESAVALSEDPQASATALVKAIQNAKT